MFSIPVVRWGEPYTSMEMSEVVHFATGEPVATMSLANGGMVKRDLRKAEQAREKLREIPIAELLKMMKKAGELYLNADLPLGEAKQSPDQFVKQQSASTGLPEKLCKANMQKNLFVLSQMSEILQSLTRGLDLEVLSRGYGEERGVPISFQANSPVVGLVLPSNSPGVHTLWLPMIPLQIGLVLKPGSQEPWTPYRLASAFVAAGVPKEAISLYPGPNDVGGAVMDGCDRSMIFGSAQTVEKFKGNPNVQVHGPGFSKIIFGGDMVDRWEEYLDLMVESVAANSGRGCINASGIWASRHTRDIADAIAKRLAKIEPLPPNDPNAELAAFTVAGAGEAINNMIDADVELTGVTDVTAKHRSGPRRLPHERYDFLLPTVLHVESHESAAAHREYMFPFVSVVECPQDRFISAIGPTLVATVITEDTKLKRKMLDATNIDRLNFGKVPTTKLNWLQPHEGNIIDFLFRARAFQQA
jgi:acyl-CoA reductase-like NAD-dependent aldehyde dehydrogenase